MFVSDEFFLFKDKSRQRVLINEIQGNISEKINREVIKSRVSSVNLKRFFISLNYDFLESSHVSLHKIDTRKV